MNYLQLLNNLNWTGIATASATLCMALVAKSALDSWKKKMRAQNKIDFLDDLVGSVHTYIQEMNAPIEYLKLSNIGVEAFSSTSPLSPENGDELSGMIKYITEHGKQDQIQLFEHLRKATPSRNKMLSLVTKGQVLGLNDYNRCYCACHNLSLTHGQIESFASMIGHEHLNWKNPKVRKTLNTVMTINAETIRERHHTEHTALLEFVKAAYDAI